MRFKNAPMEDVSLGDDSRNGLEQPPKATAENASHVARGHLHKRWIGLAAAFALACVVVFATDGATTYGQSMPENIQMKTTSTPDPSEAIVQDNNDNSITDTVANTNANTNAENEVCRGLCAARFQARLRQHGVDLLDTRQLLANVRKAIEGMHAMMRQDYGDQYFQAMFFKDGVSRGRASWLSAGGGTVSIDRFRRKLQMKVLQGQMKLYETERTQDKCDCTAPGHEPDGGGTRSASDTAQSQQQRRRLNDPTQPDEQQNEELFENRRLETEIESFFNRFVWATGGHSAAAAHGNLHNESYTAYMTRAVQPVFAAAGIDFEGRNYAMGGMSSGPEISLCNEAIFGTDADVISWDFGMTDGRAFEKTLLYASRSGVHRNRPMHVSMIVDGRGYQNRIKQIEIAEAQGLPAMLLDRTTFQQVKEALPDMFGLTEAEMAAMPPFVRDFRCGNDVEKGDPNCGVNKYNGNICRNRKYMASWHPGW